MARRIDKLPRDDRYRRYPWNVWADGGCWQAFRGEDFACEPRAFVNAVQQYARRKGLKAETRVVGDTVKFRLRHRPPALTTESE